jgi:hypothetical protein
VLSHVDTRLAVLWIEMERDSGAAQVSEGARLQSNDFPFRPRSAIRWQTPIRKFCGIVTWLSTSPETIRLQPQTLQ